MRGPAGGQIGVRAGAAAGAGQPAAHRVGDVGVGAALQEDAYGPPGGADDRDVEGGPAVRVLSVEVRPVLGQEADDGNAGAVDGRVQRVVSAVWVFGAGPVLQEDPQDVRPPAQGAAPLLRSGCEQAGELGSAALPDVPVEERLELARPGGRGHRWLVGAPSPAHANVLGCWRCCGRRVACHRSPHALEPGYGYRGRAEGTTTRSSSQAAAARQR